MQMQVNNTTQTQNFGSTRINAKKLSGTPLNKIFAPLEDCFEFKGFGHSKNDKFVKNPQAFTDKIGGSQAAVVHSADGDIVIIGKDGGSGSADAFIGRVLKEKFGDAVTFTDDIAPMKADGPVIDMTKINK